MKGDAFKFRKWEDVGDSFPQQTAGPTPLPRNSTSTSALTIRGVEDTFGIILAMTRLRPSTLASVFKFRPPSLSPLLYRTPHLHPHRSCETPVKKPPSTIDGSVTYSLPATLKDTSFTQAHLCAHHSLALLAPWSLPKSLSSSTLQSQYRTKYAKEASFEDINYLTSIILLLQRISSN